MILTTSCPPLSTLQRKRTSIQTLGVACWGEKPDPGLASPYLGMCSNVKWRASIRRASFPVPGQAFAFLSVSLPLCLSASRTLSLSDAALDFTYKSARYSNYGFLSVPSPSLPSPGRTETTAWRGLQNGAISF